MKMKGTALAILMSLAMVFAMMPMMAGAAYADSEVEYDGVKYTLHDNGEATVSGHTDALPDNVIIPDKIKSGNVDYAVTSIGEYAFSWCGSLASITIPASVTSIGEGAFFLCSNLGTVTFAEESKLESIGDHAFRETGITSITIPESVTSIGESAFQNCSILGTVTFAEGSKLESIGDSAFRKTGITSIAIPESVTSIGGYAFFNCSKLGTVTFAEGSKFESIGESAFGGTGITSIILPEGITELTQYLFSGCSNLKEVSIPSTVNEIKTRAFEGCNALEKIYFGGSMSQWDAIAGEKPEITPILCVYAPAGKTLIYNGEEQTGVDSSEGYTLSGTVSAKVAGSYQATATLNEGNIWSDGTTDPKIIDWKIDKAAAKVTAPAGKTLTYDGQEQTGVEAGEGYTLDGASATDAGTYTATATLKEDPNCVYGWSDGTTDPKIIDWKIDKANNPLSIKGKTAAVKYKKLKKKNQKLAVTKVITFTKKGQGKLTYTKASGNKKISISKTTGKVTVKKGLKKGTYKIKVKVKAAGNANYNASTWKTATFKIKVK